MPPPPRVARPAANRALPVLPFRAPRAGGSSARGYQNSMCRSADQLRTASSTNGDSVLVLPFAGVIALWIHGRPVTRSMILNAV